MVVYSVTYNNGYDAEITLGVFSTMEKAKEYINHPRTDVKGLDPDIEEIKLDEELDHLNRLL